MRRGIALALVFVALAAAGAERSRVIYPGAPSAFPHGRHRDMACDRCHQGVMESTSPRRGLESQPCAPCHKDNRSAGSRGLLAAAHINYSHRAHGLRGAGCEACHPGEEPGLPSMRSCLSCHEGQGGPQRCKACHPAGPSGKLVTSYPTGRLRPTSAQGDLDHNAPSWARDHRAAARGHRETCDACHTEGDCLGCHGGILRPMAIHSGEWMTLHPLAARRNDPDCTQCHRYQTTCLGCHQKAQVGPESVGRPASVRLHPPAWAQNHGREARRDVRACASCHRESTCIACHKVGEARLSPHPPGFRAQCGLWLSRNIRACVKCHGSREEVERRCR